MKKSLLLVSCLIITGLSYAQQKNESTIYLGGKPGTDSKNPEHCFKLADFKNKLSVTSGIDSVTKIDILQVVNKKPIANTSFTSVKELQNFDLYSWIQDGGSTATAGKTSRNQAAQKSKLAPGDRLAIEVRYLKNGKQESIIRSFFLCK
jgi:hypothetical protein